MATTIFLLSRCNLIDNGRMTLRAAIGKLLRIFGYEVRRLKHGTVCYPNFENLATLYEHSINEDGLITPNEMRPKLLARLLGTPPSEAYFIIRALAKCRNLPGDVCEFGVAEGQTSALIANELLGSGGGGGEKRLHLFDSFEGLPAPSASDELKDDIFSLGSMEAYAGKMSWPEKVVRARLADVSFPEDRFEIHKGFIERLIHDSTNLPQKVCFAYVDFDFYEPIKVALGFLHTVTAAGAIIVVDDYDYFSTGAKAAVDEFIAAKNATRANYDFDVPHTRYGHFAILTRLD